MVTIVRYIKPPAGRLTDLMDLNTHHLGSGWAEGKNQDTSWRMLLHAYIQFLCDPSVVTMDILLEMILVKSSDAINPWIFQVLPRYSGTH